MSYDDFTKPLILNLEMTTKTTLLDLKVQRKKKITYFSQKINFILFKKDT